MNIAHRYLENVVEDDEEKTSMIFQDSLSAPDLPFPIFQISQAIRRYLLYDINTVTWLRRTHNILGVFIGSLPQSPQQNVFLGLPLELQPEEATLLLEKGLAFIADDLQIHKIAIKSVPKGLTDYKATARREAFATAKAVVKHKQLKTQEVLQRLKVDPAISSRDKTIDKDEHDESIFDTPQEPSSEPILSGIVPYSSTPTTSYPPMATPSKHSSSPLPEANASSYALFKHLHASGYFMSPGLRFGCQFSVYPGDPLRFHSHFLAMGHDWDEEIDILDLIGGGRLGTGVKKGWLIGGALKNSDTNAKPDAITKNAQSSAAEDSEDFHVRTFCVEWGGM